MACGLTSPKRVADYLDTSTKTIIRLIKAGVIPGEKVGAHWKVSKQWLKSIEENGHPTGMLEYQIPALPRDPEDSQQEKRSRERLLNLRKSLRTQSSGRLLPETV